MDINQAKLEELLLVLEVKRLDLKIYGNFQDMWSSQDIYQAIAKYYLQENNIIETNEEKLYEWAKQKARYALLNSLLKMQVHRLLHQERLKDNFVLNNLKSLFDIAMDMFQIWSEKSMCPTVPLSTIDRSTTHQFVRELLIEVDPTLKWLAIYNEMLQNNKIIFLNDLNEDEQKKILEKTGGVTNVCVHSEEVPFIVVTLNGNIADVVTIIHEFAHYNNFYPNPQAKISGTLLESSSIFYEYYALLFLERKGYSKEETDTIRKDRLANIFELSLMIHNVCNYLQKYIEMGEIREEYELQAAQKNIANSLATLSEEMKESFLKMDEGFFDPKTSIHKSCDRCIEQLIAHPEYFYQCYPYIVGNYLAMMGMDQIQSGNNILPRIKELTENLCSINPSSFFESVGCEIEDREEKPKIILPHLS